MNATVFGETRTRIKTRHALIAPDGHVLSTLPGMAAVRPVVLISPELGARFAQILVDIPPGQTASAKPSATQTAGFVINGGKGTLSTAGKAFGVTSGSYFYTATGWELRAGTDPLQVVLFQKRYVLPEGGGAPPDPVVGQEQEVVGAPFLGDERARLQVLLPDHLAFDLAMNVFTYDPGAHLPFVETHVMEHGLYMLSGQGVYRLEDEWYPVQAGDTLWMAAYCPQWFVAMGRAPARYLYYKDVNRLPLG